VNVQYASDPRRFKVTTDSPKSGWLHKFSFYALSLPVPHSIRVNVQHAFEPHRFRVTTDEVLHSIGNKANWKAREGWKHVWHFYAFRSWRTGLQQINVLEASAPHRYKVSIEGQGKGWTDVFHFFAFLDTPKEPVIF
jgi:hypothetical protein